MIGNNEDCEMPPVVPHGCVTPDSKGIHHGRNADSSQKDPLPARKSNGSQQITPMNGDKSHKNPSLHQDGEKREVKQSGPNTHLSPLSDPISPFSSLPGNTTPKVKERLNMLTAILSLLLPPVSEIRKMMVLLPAYLQLLPKPKCLKKSKPAKLQYTLRTLPLQNQKVGE